MSATAQVNARIDPELKRRGDEGLAAAGLTPTEGVRALYELAASNTQNPSKLVSVLYPDRTARTADEEMRRRERRALLVIEGAELVDKAYKRYAVGADATATETHEASSLSFDELKQLAYQERYAELMGWGE